MADAVANVPDHFHCEQEWLKVALLNKLGWLLLSISGSNADNIDHATTHALHGMHCDCRVFVFERQHLPVTLVA